MTTREEAIARYEATPMVRLSRALTAMRRIQLENWSGAFAGDIGASARVRGAGDVVNLMLADMPVTPTELYAMALNRRPVTVAARPAPAKASAWVAHDGPGMVSAAIARAADSHDGQAAAEAFRAAMVSAVTGKPAAPADRRSVSVWAPAPRYADADLVANALRDAAEASRWVDDIDHGWGHPTV